MYQKVLIAEDLHSITEGIAQLLGNLNIEALTQVQYCDDAMLKLKKAAKDGEPYELLITDLSFKADHRTQQYPSGEALIAGVRSEFPSLHIIAYSIEDRISRVKHLMEVARIQAYVCKGRQGIQELKEAIQTTYTGATYLSPALATALQQKGNMHIQEFDIHLLAHLAQGYSQKEISVLFKEKGREPSGLSSIEKRLNQLKLILKSQNTVQLIAVAKDLGLI